jgi:anti-anti-sigma factor
MNLSPSSEFTTSSDGFRIEVRPDRDRVLVAPHGELDIATVPDLAAEIDGLVASGFGTVVIDLRPTLFIDSTALHLLVGHAARSDVTISVIDGSRAVSRVFDVAGVRDAIRFEPAP